MSEAAIERCSPKIDALPGDFGFWQQIKRRYWKF